MFTVKFSDDVTVVLLHEPVWHTHPVYESDDTFGWAGWYDEPCDDPRCPEGWTLGQHGPQLLPQDSFLHRIGRFYGHKPA